MTRTQRSDPLLMAGKLITYIGQGLMAVAAFGIVVGMPAVFFFQERIQDEWLAESSTSGAFPILAVISVMILGFGAVALVFLFLKKLRDIINTVGEGDPFVPENAERLTAMAWMMLAIQALVIPIGGLALYIAKTIETQEGTIDAGFSLNGMVMVIILFILARVFRKGSEMREDLEGTV